MSRESALVTADWVEEHLADDGVVLIEVDEDTTAYDKGHIAGAIKLDWKNDLQDPVRRDFVSKEQFEEFYSHLVEVGIEVLDADGAGSTFVPAERSTLAQTIPALTFDVGETVLFYGVVPADYQGGSLTVELVWAATFVRRLRPGPGPSPARR